MQSETGHKRRPQRYFIFWLLGIAVGAAAAAWALPRLIRGCSDQDDIPWNF
jgi:hypothetical protein